MGHTRLPDNDLPPGTGDVSLTAMQSIPITGLVIVSVPQDLVSMIVSKAVNMARKMDTGFGRGRKHELYYMPRLQEENRHI